MLKAKKLSIGGSASTPAGQAINSAAALERYYNPDVAEQEPGRALDEYYRADATADVAAQWWSPAGIIITDGERLAPGELKAAMEGFDAGGNRMVKNQPNRTPAHDFTFSAPKSVSVAYALGNTEQRRQISQDMLAAVRQTFNDLHKSGAFVTRRGAAGKIHESAKDLKIAIIPHYQSRAADPQVHFHCVMPNSALRQDGKTGAIHSRPFYNMNRNSAVSVSFLRNLSQRMEARGMETANHTKTGFDIAGIPKALEKEFSTRRQTILAEAARAEVPATTPREIGEQRRRVALETRKPKARVPSRGLDDVWRARAAALGHAPAKVWGEISRRGREALQRRVALLREVVGSLGVQARGMARRVITRLRVRSPAEVQRQTVARQRTAIDPIEIATRVYARRVSEGQASFAYALTSLQTLERREIERRGEYELNPVHHTMTLKPGAAVPSTQDEWMDRLTARIDAYEQGGGRALWPEQAVTVAANPWQAMADKGRAAPGGAPPESKNYEKGRGR